MSILCDALLAFGLAAGVTEGMPKEAEPEQEPGA